jgi:iron complex outermembrane receptor protein
MDKFIQGTCTAICVWTSQLPAAANDVTHEHQFPQIDVKTESLEYRQFDKVEVTGSAILSKEAKETLPVQVITQREIERSGSTNLPELLQRLPLMGNFAENGTLPTSAGGPQSAAIHGYASGTLVLLNGKRLPYYGNNSIDGERAFVDLNILPLTAIERIELLTDGASTRYGSDAIAGVVNIITKPALQGTLVSSQLTRPAGGKASGEQLNLSWGKGNIDIDGFNLQVHFSLEHQNPLYAADRAASKEAAFALDTKGQTLWALGYNTTVHGWPASIENPDGTISHPVLTHTGRCPTQWYKLSNGQDVTCYRNAQTGLTLYPGLDKRQFFARGELQVNSNWRGFGELLLGEYVQSFVSKDSYDLRATLSDGRSALFTSQPLGPITQSYTNKSHQATLGMRGQLEDWDVVASLSSGEHRVRRDYTQGIIRSAQRQVLQNSGVSLEELLQDVGQISAATWEKFRPFFQTAPLRLDDAKTHLNALDVLASKELFMSDHGPVALGLGLNWRSESIVNVANPLLNNIQRPDFQARRDNMAVYGELQIPVNAHSEISAALRQDHYSDFGNVKTGKFGWRWRPDSEFMVRGSVGTGFRAPTLGQMLPMSTTQSYYLDPISGNFIFAKYYGNPELKPERSLQSSLGARWEPNRSWSLGADLWTLHLKDTFGAFTPEWVLNDPQLRAQYLVDAQDDYLKLQNQNLGHALRQGIDYDVQWRQPVEFGRIRWTIKGTRHLKSKSQALPGGPYTSDLGQFNDATYTVTPKHQFTMTLALEQSGWSIFSRLNYRSGNTETANLLNPMTDEYKDIQRRVTSFWTLDLGTHWQASQRWTLSSHLLNLTDNTPPLRLASTGILNGVDTRYADHYGRTLKLKAEYRF